MRKFFIVLLLSIPLILSIKTIMLINGWYFYIPVAWIMFVNWTSITKIWMSEIVVVEDMRVCTKTGLLLVVFFIIAYVLH